MEELISKQLVKYLADRGVEYVFGLCGHTNIAVLAELENSPVRFINTRHEQIAAHIADGYARAARKTAVVLSHLGPGLTNASTGVANAALDSIPMVVIAGDIPSHYYGKHPHQEINLHSDASQSEIYRPFAKRVWRVERPDLFPEILDKAFQLAESGRPGPVLVSVPMDIFSKKVDTALFERLAHHTKQLHKPSIDDLLAERIAAAGHPVFRYDRRGIGDSTGDNRGFLGARADLIAAAAAFRAEAPQLDTLLGFGNCDAASTLALFGRDAGIDRLLLANPWVIDQPDDLPPAAAIRARYRERLRDPATWRRLISGGIDLAKFVKGLKKLATTPLQPDDLARRVTQAIADWGDQARILLAAGDATAIAYQAAATGAPTRTTIIDTDSHSFAREADQHQVQATITAALTATA